VFFLFHTTSTLMTSTWYFNLYIGDLDVILPPQQLLHARPPPSDVPPPSERITRSGRRVRFPDDFTPLVIIFRRGMVWWPNSGSSLAAAENILKQHTTYCRAREYSESVFLFGLTQPWQNISLWCKRFTLRTNRSSYHRVNDDDDRSYIIIYRYISHEVLRLFSRVIIVRSDSHLYTTI